MIYHPIALILSTVVYFVCIFGLLTLAAHFDTSTAIGIVTSTAPFIILGSSSQARISFSKHYEPIPTSKDRSLVLNAVMPAFNLITVFATIGILSGYTERFLKFNIVKDDYALHQSISSILIGLTFIVIACGLGTFVFNKTIDIIKLHTSSPVSI